MNDKEYIDSLSTENLTLKGIITEKVTKIE
jgi:hypothetical protein